MTTTKELLGGGGGAPTAKFPSIGTTTGGFINKVPVVSQQTSMTTNEPMFWDDGQPKWQIEVTVLTDERDPEIPDDDGSRRIYVKGLMMSAVREAVADAGADDVEAGGTLFVTYVGDRPSKTRGFNPAKVFEAKYTLPVAGAAPLTAAANSADVYGDEEPF